jgi:hypothetical protein
MCLELVLVKVSRLLLLHGCILASRGMIVSPQRYSSPCPDTFQYRLDQNGELYGTIGVYSLDQNVVKLNVELSVGNHVDVRGIPFFNSQVTQKRAIASDLSPIAICCVIWCRLSSRSPLRTSHILLNVEREKLTLKSRHSRLIGRDVNDECAGEGSTIAVRGFSNSVYFF